MMSVGSKTSFLQKAYELQHFPSIFRTSDSKVSPDHAENISQQNIWHVESEKKKSLFSKPSSSILEQMYENQTNGTKNNQSLKTNIRQKCPAYANAACCSKRSIPLMIGLMIGSLIGGIILAVVSTAWSQSRKTYLIIFLLDILSKIVTL